MKRKIELFDEQLREAPLLTFVVKEDHKGRMQQGSLHRVGIPEQCRVKDGYWYEKFFPLYEEIFRAGYEAGEKHGWNQGS